MTTSRADIAARLRERRDREARERAASRGLESVLLLVAAIVVATALGLVYRVKMQTPGAALNLNRLSGPAQLMPYLQIIRSPADRYYVARRIYETTRHGERLQNVGALGRLRVTEDEAARLRGLESFPARIADARERRAEREAAMSRWRKLWRRVRGVEERELAIPVLTSQHLAQLKRSFGVRDFGDFRRSFFLWGGLFLLGFFAVHVFWRARGFAGDRVILPAILLLAGCGLALMISLRDPLRDTLIFVDFAQGAIAGCVALAAASAVDWERHFGRLSFVPLAGAVLLAVLLGLFGTGPGSSDARVNLFFFQPVELIRILLVFFLAGYFAQNWDALRALRQRTGRLAQRFNMPRLDYVLPVGFGVVAALVLFFWLSDLGPALVIGCLFLALYSIARNRAGLAALGLLAIVLGFGFGYLIGIPASVGQRVQIWVSPWDNAVRGGDQVADSLWALASGGVTGTGVGLGSPETVPAAHTDLILSAAGEELGLIGLLAIYGLYALLIYRALRIALRASSPYLFFLTTGLALIAGLELLLISGGLLGLIPLSGVVSPFLSYGRTSMVANFAIFGIILAVSAQSRRDQRDRFGAPVKMLGLLLGALAIVVAARLAYVQAYRADDVLVRPTLVMQGDGVRRYQYNPRLLEAARIIPKGNIFDRNGLPLAATSLDPIETHRAEYEALGVNLQQTVSRTEARHYPLGPSTFYLLGDVRTRLKQGASNTAFVERTERVRLQGYDDEVEVEAARDPATGRIVRRLKYDYRELVPLVRHRYEPDHPLVKEILNRNRDLKMSIDAGLQLRAAAILRDQLAKLGKQKGAIVVLEPMTGDLLAAVSYPWPAQFQTEPADEAEFMDRARYGLYPPGSSFKIVTAIAALLKDPALANDRFECKALADGRVGNIVRGRAVRDDVMDKVPHGSVDMARGIAVSCNAYFAQLGTNKVGAGQLFDVARRFGISTAQPPTAKQLNQYLPQAAYGQGQVVASPFQMARVAATIAAGGAAPYGRWVIDTGNMRIREPDTILSAGMAAKIASYMRAVVTSGTGRVLAKSAIPIAGKTGTAELAKAPSHAWFIGYAPFGPGAPKRIAFAILVENGQYGGTAAAPMAADLVQAARARGLL